MIINTACDVLITSILATIVFIAGSVVLIITNKSAKKKVIRTKIKTVYIVVGILFLSVSSASWIMNFGLHRGFFFGYFCIHIILFLIANIISIFYIDRSAGLRSLSTLSYISYMLAYILLPDVGFFGSQYLFFSMIHSDAIGDIMFTVSNILFTANIILLIVQLVTAKKIKKAISKQNIIDQPS